MKPFEYQRPEHTEAALAMLGSGGAYLGGGTNLLDHLKLGIREADQLVDIRRLQDPELRQITVTPDSGLRIGALVSNSALAAHEAVQRNVPVLARAILSGASGQIRNMATTGGNLLQRTRCVYFQDNTLPCNKRDPGTGCAAQEGFGRYNAILGTSPECVAVHPSDMCVALAALDAVVVVRGLTGERRIPFTEFHRLPGDTPWLDTNLQAGELITALELAALPLARHSTYRKVRDRASYAFALVSVAAALEVEGDQVKGVRLALGGAAHKPWRAETAEAALRGQAATQQNFLAAAEAELQAARPGPENAFKVELLRATIAAVLQELCATQEAQA